MEKWGSGEMGEKRRERERTWIPGILSPRVKYSVLEDERSAEVPMPYLLFSQTKTQGRFHSLAYKAPRHRHTSSACPPKNSTQKQSATHHVERLKHLSLVRRPIPIHRERRRRLAHILLCQREARTERDLGADDTVAAEEPGREDVHGAALAVGHACLAAEELAEDAGDGAAAEDGEGVAAVGGDDEVFGGDGVFESDVDCFLSFPTKTIRHSNNKSKTKRRTSSQYDVSSDISSTKPQRTCPMAK